MNDAPSRARPTLLNALMLVFSGDGVTSLPPSARFCTTRRGRTSHGTTNTEGAARGRHRGTASFRTDQRWAIDRLGTFAPGAQDEIEAVRRTIERPGESPATRTRPPVIGQSIFLPISATTRAELVPLALVVVMRAPIMQAKHAPKRFHRLSIANTPSP
jgi:hypothetical protein